LHVSPNTTCDYNKRYLTRKVSLVTLRHRAQEHHVELSDLPQVHEEPLVERLGQQVALSSRFHDLQ
jgi:hypothetical protein